MLIDLDMVGGLGFDLHQRVKRAIGLPYPEFCRHLDRLAPALFCPARSLLLRLAAIAESTK